MSEHRFALEVPLDAAGIEGFKPEQPVKVLVQEASGKLTSQLVTLDESGQGAGRFGFDQKAGSLRIVVGPASATDEQLLGLQTITVDVPARRWGEEPELKLSPIRITAFFWSWWLAWCRRFVVRGRVVCPDGRPVPGAQVCAYDVDWWWWWSSRDLLGCVTTDVNGAFEIDFTWCCGWLPIWWWNRRHWSLDPGLVERVSPVLARDPELARAIQPRPQPSLADFQAILGKDAARNGKAGTIDPAILPSLRDKLLTRVPPACELEQLRIWPWWPWQPWWDCAPDLIFRVTQACGPNAGRPEVILDEGVTEARWNIPTTLDVTLVAGQNACCLPPSNGCLDGDCLALTGACDEQGGSGRIDNIGGNPGAPAGPVGYQSPGLGTRYSDRPFGGAVSLFGTADCMDGIDYYEFKWASSAAGPWNDMPPGANGDYPRSYIQFNPAPNPPTFGSPVFSASVPIDGRHVYETLQHYEATHDPAQWALGNRVWIGNRDQLIAWLTENNFPDGTYYLQVTGYNLDASSHLTNGRVLNICGGETPNVLVLTLDNRFVGPGPADLHGHPCGPVHLCTDEPDTAFIDVHIRHADGTLGPLPPCGSRQVGPQDHLVIDFVAFDDQGHLAEYELELHYGDSGYIDLLGLATPTVGSAAWDGVPPAAQVGPGYDSALTQGAISPSWRGGTLHFEIAATTAFPTTCCYLLKLTAHKRTIVDCGSSGHANTSEYSFTIIV